LVDLKLEIQQQAAFQSVEEQALLNLIRTTDCVDRAMQRAIKPWGVTSTQYNVLRILRGSHPRGLTCSAIGDRMLTAEPDITRLLSRLKKQKLVRQQRDRHDRRMLWTQISDAGLKLLAEMDPMIAKAPVELLGHLGAADLGVLIRLLETVRASCSDRAGLDHAGPDRAVSDRSGPPTCDGSGKTTCDGK